MVPAAATITAAMIASVVVVLLGASRHAKNAGQQKPSESQPPRQP
jgi:hypothetical protein